MARGGKRSGSGRPPGRQNRLTEELKKPIVELARDCSVRALEALVKVMEDSEAPAPARISAACAVLDRAWGKPPPAVAYNDFRDRRVRNPFDEFDRLALGKSG